MSWDDRADRFEKKPVSTGVRWGLIAVGVVVLFAVILGALSFGGAWAKKGADVVGPANVEKQYDQVITNWESLTSAADNACMAVGSVTTTENSPTFVESPAMAYVATYRSIRVDYNAAQADLFKAKVVGPSGYPSEIPNFVEATGQTPDFCSVGTQLAELKAAAE